jgi:transcriptional regulator with XRE-family HTH domain
MLTGVDPGELLRAVRRRHALTQAELAQRAGTSQPVISAYEHGRRDPTYGTLARLVEAAGEQLQIGAQAGTAGPPPARDISERARRLVDVLLLADAIPARPRSRRLQAPRLVSR